MHAPHATDDASSLTRVQSSQHEPADLLAPIRHLSIAAASLPVASVVSFRRRER
jgi:hypothetical protein